MSEIDQKTYDETAKRLGDELMSITDRTMFQYGEIGRAEHEVAPFLACNALLNVMISVVAHNDETCMDSVWEIIDNIIEAGKKSVFQPSKGDTH